MWLPATFESCCESSSDKAISPVGACYDKSGLHTTRIDYVAITSGISCRDGSAEVWHDFVMPNQGFDHLPTAVRVDLPFVSKKKMVKRRAAEYDRAGVQDPSKLEHSKNCCGVYQGGSSLVTSNHPHMPPSWTVTFAELRSRPSALLRVGPGRGKSTFPERRWSTWPTDGGGWGGGTKLGG